MPQDPAEIARTAREAVGEERRDRARRQRARSDDRRKKRSAMDSPVLLAVLGSVLVVFTAVNLSGKGFYRRPPEPTEAELQQSVGEELDLLVMEIETWQESEGEVPEAIDELIPPATDAWSYERLGPGSYRVSLTVEGKTARYDTPES